MSWTDERVELLKSFGPTDFRRARLRRSSAASPAMQSLARCTGSAFRPRQERIERRRRASARHARGTHMMRVGAPAIRGNTALAHAYEMEAEAPPALIENIIPIGQRRTILELNEQTCRWPIGDPGSTEFFFCGGNTISGLPYCAFHSRVAYQPAAIAAATGARSAERSQRSGARGCLMVTGSGLRAADCDDHDSGPHRRAPEWAAPFSSPCRSDRRANSPLRARYGSDRCRGRD